MVLMRWGTLSLLKWNQFVMCQTSEVRTNRGDRLEQTNKEESQTTAAASHPTRTQGGHEFGPRE